MINREYLHAEIYLENFKQWKHEWEPHYLEMSRDFIFRNTFADLERIMTVFKETGTKPEFEAYDIGHLHNAHLYHSQGEIEAPFYVQFVTGSLGGIASTIPHLVHMAQTAQSLFGKDIFFSTYTASDVGENLLRYTVIESSEGKHREMECFRNFPWKIANSVLLHTVVCYTYSHPSQIDRNN